MAISIAYLLLPRGLYSTSILPKDNTLKERTLKWTCMEETKMKTDLSTYMYKEYS